MSTTRYQLWKRAVWSTASVGYAVMVTGLSFWVVNTFGCVLSSWAATGIVVAVPALLTVGYLLAAKHGLRLYTYVLAVTVGSMPLCLLISLGAFRSCPCDMPHCLL